MIEDGVLDASLELRDSERSRPHGIEVFEVAGVQRGSEAQWSPPADEDGLRYFSMRYRRPESAPGMSEHGAA